MSFIGTAGWSIPGQYKGEFPGEGSHLQRYASRLKCVEINSSFSRPHQRVTYEKWAAAVPEDFLFSVKIPRAVTQHKHLQQYGEELNPFLEAVEGLAGKLGVLLVQLPPSLAYDAEVAAAFFQDLSRPRVVIACEPRHASWFTPDAEKALANLCVTRVAADPPRAPGDGVPGGDTRTAYYRLHGSPEIYYSDYTDTQIAGLAGKLRPGDWCIFDNTAAFAALGNALILQKKASGHSA